ncbi:DUF192 domain-containing protein [Thioalkalivibrio sp. ALJT]|uniref:DUF192 domain-containing protein n=1 Tax=Thioalkalivibrio sp. ALJT TaxID=1158146 RepID=UPI00037E4956
MSIGYRPFGRTSNSRIGLLLVLLLLGIGNLQADARPLPVENLVVGEETLALEIAATDRSRRIGLMHRDHLPDDHGMLFIWPRAAEYGMWMQNTRIPLDVAFIDADYTIVNIASMKPHSTRIHSARRPVPYALEVNAGWFERHDIRPGDRIPDLESLVRNLD